MCDERSFYGQSYQRTFPDHPGGEAKELLAILKNKLNLLQRDVEELRIRAMTTPDISVQIMTLPETICCTRRYTGLTVQERYDATYAFFHECIENGYVLAQEPLFLVSERTDYLEGRISSEPFPFRVCVPVLPESAPEGAVRFPSCRVLSVFLCSTISVSDTPLTHRQAIYFYLPYLFSIKYTEWRFFMH